MTTIWCRASLMLAFAVMALGGGGCMMLTTQLGIKAQGTSYHEPTKLQVTDTWLDAQGRLIVRAEWEPTPGDPGHPVKDGGSTLALEPVWFELDLPKAGMYYNQITQAMFRPGSPDVAKLQVDGFTQIPIYENPDNQAAHTEIYVGVTYSSKLAPTPSFPQGMGVDPLIVVDIGQEGKGESGLKTFRFFENRFRDDGHPALYILMPATVVLDVALFPFEFVLFQYGMYGMFHPQQ